MRANVLINSECRVCLADFGLTRILEDTSSVEGLSTHKAGGTVRWMPPEILDPDRSLDVQGLTPTSLPQINEGLHMRT